MQITLFARVDPGGNPYLLLYKKALEKQGLVVNLSPELNLSWLRTNRKSCDVLHLHWIESAYRAKNPSARLFFRFLQGLLRFVNFSVALLLARLMGKTIVYTVHNLESNIEQSRPFIILNRLANRLVFSLAHRIHVHNNYSRRLIETVYRQGGERIQLVPHGNYIGCYLNQVSPEQARQRFGIPDETFVYLFLGRLRPYKGLDELITAFRQLDLPHSMLLIAGQPSKSQDRQKLLEMAHHHPAIKIIPQFIPDEELQLYMKASDVCVLPYRDITTSGAALLALSFGRPIIAPAVASFPELITPTTGLLYDPAQPDGLVRALRQASQQVWSEAEILAYARQFDWDRLGPQLAALYKPHPEPRPAEVKFEAG